MRKRIKFLLPLLSLIFLVGVTVASFGLIYNNSNIVSAKLNNKDISIKNKNNWTNNKLEQISSNEAYFVINEFNTLIKITDEGKKQTELVIPDNVVNIGGKAFDGCNLLESVWMPDSVLNTGDLIFYSCTNLRNVRLSQSLKTLKTGMFEFCSSLVNIEIPDSITTIEDTVFFSCSSLANVKLPENLKSIGSFTFGNCSALNKITLPNQLITISEFAFDSSSIENIIIPPSVTTFGKNVFNADKNLKAITVLNDLIFPANAFDGLTNIYFYVNSNVTKQNLIRDSRIHSQNIAVANKDVYVDDYNQLIKIVDASIDKTEIIIPENVFSISGKVLNNFSKLKKLIIFSNDLIVSKTWLKDLPKDTIFVTNNEKIKSELITNGIPENQITSTTIDPISPVEPTSPIEPEKVQPQTDFYTIIIILSIGLASLFLGLGIAIPLIYKNKKIKQNINKSNLNKKSLVNSPKIIDKNVSNNKIDQTTLDSTNNKGINIKITIPTNKIEPKPKKSFNLKNLFKPKK